MLMDANGRLYAREGELKVDDKVQVDGDFTCVPVDLVRHVFEDPGGLFILCRHGQHYLDGQLNEEGAYVGIYPMG